MGAGGWFLSEMLGILQPVIKMIQTVTEATEQIISLRKKHLHRAILIGISGIDASGKGYITAQIQNLLLNNRYQAVAINIDGWLNLPEIRFNRTDPARHFYDHAIRFEEMFGDLVLPLRKNRSIELTVHHTEETADRYRTCQYIFGNVEIILLEGIFLFKKPFRHYFDLAIWIECSFEPALKRAIHRKQEALSDEETIRAYETIYFPAQRIHFEADEPQVFAEITIRNEETKLVS